jgi:hypothetical protein
MVQPPRTDEVLHAILRDALEEAIRDSVDTSLAQIVHVYRTLPPKKRTGATIQRVLSALAILPDEHWLPRGIRYDE